ncbi:hypothetical protein K0B04_02785 [Patescibacteria group bacterium]|nr:hypothetical protein [Patescibacteria group bacterium]
MKKIIIIISLTLLIMLSIAGSIFFYIRVQERKTKNNFLKQSLEVDIKSEEKTPLSPPDVVSDEPRITETYKGVPSHP